MLAIHFSPPVCGMTDYIDYTPVALTGNAFVYKAQFGASTLFTISGGIDYQGDMIGTLTAETSLLCEATNLTWSARRASGVP